MVDQPVAVEQAPRAGREIEMEAAAGPALSLDVPLVVDAGVADNWAEAH